MTFTTVSLRYLIILATIAYASPAMGQASPTHAPDTKPFVIHRMPIPGDFAFAEAVDVNRHGEAPGSVGGPSGTRATLYVRNQVHILEDLGGLTNYAVGVNDSGQVAGSVQAHPWWGSRAARWNPDGSIQVMLPLSGNEHDNCWATAINGPGDIVGHSQVSNGMARAFLWRVDEGCFDLGTFGGPYSQATDVNDHGVVVGWADDSGAGRLAFIWEEGVLTALESPQGTVPGSRAQAINNEGVVVGGIAGEVWGATRAAFWDASGKVREIHGLDGFSSIANDINDRGTIVGELQDEAGRRAFLHESGHTRDLNEFVPAGSGWSFERAVAISDDGRIIVTGRADGEHASFILAPRTTRSLDFGN